MTQPPYPQRRPPAPQRAPGPHPSYETRRDAEAAIAARHELGPEYEEDLAAGLAERVEQLAAMRTAELRHASQQDHQGDRLARTTQTQRFVTALASVTAGIPISIVGLAQGELTGTVVCWAGIVGVNMAQALGARRRR